MIGLSAEHFPQNQKQMKEIPIYNEVSYKLAAHFFHVDVCGKSCHTQTLMSFRASDGRNMGFTSSTAGLPEVGH
jgi:hypothetical protein